MWESGRVGVLNLRVRAGLPVPDGAVLTRRAHEEFLRTSGILRDIRAAGRGAAWRVAEIRSKHASCPVEGELNRALCELLIGLNAKTAVVLSGDLEKGGLSSIPEVRDAVRDARREPRGLERQIAAVARGEDPVGPRGRSVVRAFGEFVPAMTFGTPASPRTGIPRSAYTAPQSGTRETSVRRDRFERRSRK